MNIKNAGKDICIWDGTPVATAFGRTTHMAVAAHQDDAEFMAYQGILECFGNPNKHFTAVVLTDGASSPRNGQYKSITDQQMSQMRVQEQRKAALIGEYSACVQLMYSSKQVKDKRNTAVVDDILEVLTTSQPEIVYTHNLADRHDTHVAVALRTIAAIRRMPRNIRPKTLLGCEVWRGLDWMEDEEKVRLDTSGKQNLAYALTNIFESQISGGKNYGAGVTGRRRANATFQSSHSVDGITHITYAMDLTPLIVDDALDIQQFVLGYINKFHDIVAEKLKT